MLDLYGAANILVAEVRLDRLYPGGPSKALFVGKFGPDGQTLGSFELTAKDSNDLPRMMSRRRPADGRAVRPGAGRRNRPRRSRPDHPAASAAEGRGGNPTAPLIQPTVVQVLVTERDPGAVSQSVAQIRGLAGVIWVTEAPLPGGGANLAVNFRGDATALASVLLLARLGGNQSGRRSCA